MKKILLIAVIALPLTLFAQNEHRSLVEGNSFYKEKDFVKATAEYEKALQVNKSSIKGHYNLGNALYEINNFDKAIEHYLAAVENAKDDNIKAKAFHNLGNAYVKKQQLKEACDAYKNSLRINPKDVETKHNLAQTLKKIQTPPPPSPQNQDPKDGENEEKPKDDIDRMMDMMDNEDKKTQENKKNPPSRRRKPEKDW